MSLAGTYSPPGEGEAGTVTGNFRALVAADVSRLKLFIRKQRC